MMNSMWREWQRANEDALVGVVEEEGMTMVMELKRVGLVRFVKLYDESLLRYVDVRMATIMLIVCLFSYQWMIED